MILSSTAVEASSQNTKTLVASETSKMPELTSLTNSSIVDTAPKTVEITVTESEYQKQQKDTAARIAAQIAKLAATAAKNNVTSEEKLLWVQKAASAYGIDWRVLAAVWQKESGQQFYTTVRSSAGAQGPCQFMPGTWKGYAKDGNGDGVKDVYDARDCLFAAADLLARNGGSSGNYYKALLSYNHATWYVEAVLKLAYSY